VETIVVGTDGSPGAEAAVEKVIEMAGGRGAAVNLVCAYPGRSTLERIGMSAKQESVDMRGVAADVLARDAHRLEDAGFTVEKHVREGDPANVILDVAEEQGANLIVVGARGSTGTQRRFTIGGVASKVAHHAPTSLLIVRQD
jgi:nucleotide-binding universal stress UspA family protein